MPKTKFRATRTSRPTPLRIAFKLGNRKSTVSAHNVSSEELLKQYFSPKLPKDKPKIAKVLNLRGVKIEEPVEVPEEVIAE